MKISNELHYFGVSDPNCPSSYYFVILDPEDQDADGANTLAIFAVHQFDRDKVAFGTPTIFESFYSLGIDFENTYDTFYVWNDDSSVEEVRQALTKAGCIERKYSEKECYNG